MIKSLIKGFTVCVLLFFTIMVIALLWLLRPLDEPAERINVLSSNYLIAHAGGAIDGYIYTNSKEALMNALDKGFKYIELDLYETIDSNVVCLHSLEDYKIMTSTDSEIIDTNTFLSHRLYGKYTPMTLNDAIKIWEEHPFCFVTDKISDPKVLNRYFRKNRDKVIVEAFTLDDYFKLKVAGYKPMLTSDGSIKGMIWLIITNWTNSKISGVVTCHVCDLLLRIYKNMGVEVMLYTVNEESYLKSHIGKDIDVVYTDFIYPSINNGR